jgi:hypothetical protein
VLVAFAVALSGCGNLVSFSLGHTMPEGDVRYVDGTISHEEIEGETTNDIDEIESSNSSVVRVLHIDSSWVVWAVGPGLATLHLSTKTDSADYDVYVYAPP